MWLIRKFGCGVERKTTAWVCCSRYSWKLVLLPLRVHQIARARSHGCNSASGSWHAGIADGAVRTGSMRHDVLDGVVGQRTRNGVRLVWDAAGEFGNRKKQLLDRFRTRRGALAATEDEFGIGTATAPNPLPTASLETHRNHGANHITCYIICAYQFGFFLFRYHKFRTNLPHGQSLDSRSAFGFTPDRCPLSSRHYVSVASPLSP